MNKHNRNTTSRHYIWKSCVWLLDWLMLYQSYTTFIDLKKKKKQGQPDGRETPLAAPKLVRIWVAKKKTGQSDRQTNKQNHRTTNPIDPPYQRGLKNHTHMECYALEMISFAPILHNTCIISNERKMPHHRFLGNVWPKSYS